MNVMTNDEYSNELTSRIMQLNLLRAKVISLSAKIIGQTIFKEDFYFCSSADRCTHLIDGFVLMLKERNLTCVGALLRMQMDNCMRTYAAFIAQDKDAVSDCIISGKAINREKDISGIHLSDGHLKKEISKMDPAFKQVYDQASGYVHLSAKAFYQTVVGCEDNCIEFQIGMKLPEKRNSDLLEAADAFVHFVELHNNMLKVVAKSKLRYDALQVGRNDEETPNPVGK